LNGNKKQLTQIISRNLLSSKSLQVSQINLGETRLRTTINDLNPNQNYTIQIFANPEIVGTSFNFTTFPARRIFFLFLSQFQFNLEIK